jgi:hypothetical protein
MGFTAFPNGISSFGVPVIPSAGPLDIPITGQVFFVNNATALSPAVTGVNNVGAGYGSSPLRPFSTIAYAISQCVANRGDVIYVLPGHAENIIAAGGITVNVAGVSIIGIGGGAASGSTLGPTLTLKTATTATFKVTAANVTVRNIYFNATGIDAIAKIFDIQAANFTLDNCEVYFAKTGAVALKGLVVDTAAHANGLTLTNNYIHGDAAANCTNFVQLVGGDSIVIANNVIVGNFTTSLGPINNITAALTNVLITSNILVNKTAVSTSVIVLLTGSTGFITNNRLGILNGTAPITADSVIVGGNYYAAAVGVSAGTLI